LGIRSHLSIEVPDHVYILGKADGWEDAPIMGDFHVWGLNTHIMSRPFDVIFEPHDVEWWLEHHNDITWWHKRDQQYKRHIDRINEMSVPYLTLKEYDFIPTSFEYPVEEICESIQLDYFTGGVDFMLAYAIFRGVKKIDLYGVHTTRDDEYEYQKPSLEFWIGLAKGNGIDINIHGDSTLLKTMYQGKIHTNDCKNPDGLRYGYFTPQREYARS
jgi:hypothetical protein